jgi:hypothetical protein
MFESLQRSWDLLSESLSLLARDKRLLLFPIISAITTILVNLTFLMPLFASGMLSNVMLSDRLRHGDSATYGFLFVFYYINYFVTVFFNSALVAAAGMALEGAHVTLSAGLAVAGSRLGRIAYWTFIASTIGLVLRAIQNQAGRAGRAAAGLFGMAWSLVTYFIIPVMVFEDRPVFDSIDRSVKLFRKAWGEEATSGFGFGLIWMLASIPGFLLISFGGRARNLETATLGFFYFILLATLASAVRGIFTAALYRYAAHAEVPNWFSSHLIQGAFVSRGGGDEIQLGLTGNQPAIKGQLTDVEEIPGETQSTYLIRVKAGKTIYRASYEVDAIDPGFRPDSWNPGTPLELRISGKWLVISGPGCSGLWCPFFKDSNPTSMITE